MRRFRMQKCDPFISRAFDRHLVDQSYSSLGSFFKLSFNTIRRKSHMVNALSVFLKELGDRTVRRWKFMRVEFNVFETKI